MDYYDYYYTDFNTHRCASVITLRNLTKSKNERILYWRNKGEEGEEEKKKLFKEHVSEELEFERFDCFGAEPTLDRNRTCENGKGHDKVIIK